MKYKVVLQPDEMNCGVACLSMICAYHGVKNLSLSIIRNFAQTDRDGNSIYSLTKAAEKLNMTSKAYACTKEDLLSDEVTYPMIVHTLVNGMYNHYQVLFEANQNKVTLGDPANGLVTLTWDEFDKIWGKKVIMFWPTENFHENVKYKRNNKMIISLIWKFKKELIITAVFTAIITGISAISAQFYSYLIDRIVPNFDLGLLAKTILAVIGIYVLTAQLNLMKLKFSISFNKKLDKELIIKIYDRITNLPMSFFSSRTPGDIMARYEDGDSLRGTITGFSVDFLADFAYAAWALVLVLTTNWQICIVAIVIQEITFVMQKIFTKKMEAQSKELMQASTEVDTFVTSSFSASETVKNYNSERLMEEGMEHRYKRYQDSKYGSSLTQEGQSNFISIINSVGNISILAILAIYLMNGSITMGEFIKLYTYVNYIFAPIYSIMSIKQELVGLGPVLERLDDVFKTETEAEMDKKKQNLQGKITSIEFDNVSFQYGMRPETLHNISFDVKEGESIGVIGTSGCGKTTLIKLILGFYPVSKGEIRMNGKDISKCTTSSVRQKIAYVSQNDFWFQDTIFNNLTIGNRNATTQDLDHVCSIVKMTDYIKKSPYGYNTKLQEGGGNLSSGEKQRFSIAKALITNPDVLILDESTSNLDANTEEFVVQELAREKDKIKIIIAHRLNTLMQCDKIIAMEKGTIVEVGTPRELIKKKEGVFRNLWDIQTKGIINNENEGAKL